MLAEFQPYWMDVTEFIEKSKFLNSSFVTSLFGAGFGAWAGAYAAQQIAGRVKAQEEIQKEVRGFNSAINVAASVTNTALGIKKQYVADLWQRYTEDKARVDAYRLRKEQGLPEHEPPLQCQIDLQVLDRPKLATAVLQSLIFEKVAARSKVIFATTTLIGAANTLDEVICKRNSWVEAFKVNRSSETVKTQLYFGLELDGGHRDVTYPSLLEAIYKTTEDCIFFSMFLINGLVADGNKARKAYLARYGGDAPKIDEPNFELPENSNLLPDAKAYESWTNGFVERSQEPAQC